MTRKNFIELLDAWDELAIKKRFRELIFEEKDGYYTIRPYNEDEDKSVFEAESKP